MKIGLMGLTFSSSNLGCVALAISFYVGLTSVLEKLNLDSEIIAVSEETDTSEFVNSRYPLSFESYHLSNPLSIIKTYNKLKTCDVVFDFTEGDSFADIYGRARFYRSIVLKILLENKQVPLVLGPQTYGPFNKSDCISLAKRIINNAFYVFSRDEKSKLYLESLDVKKSIIVTTDVAYTLPIKDNAVRYNNDKIKIGINVSGLLWDDYFNGKNSLNLSVNYIEYINGLLSYYSNNSNYIVYLIPHVGSDLAGRESDYAACYKAHKNFPNCVLLEGFTNPIDAKTALSNMDIVIAARMHASIGAFSTGVFTIPFAYSRKFEGYYGRLKYPFLIDGNIEETQEAIDKTINYISNYKKFSMFVVSSRSNAEELLSDFYDEIGKILLSVIRQ